MGHYGIAVLGMSRVSDDTSWARRRGIVLSRRIGGELLLEHHDERLADGRLELAIGASGGAEKTQDNYCTNWPADSRDH